MERDRVPMERAAPAGPAAVRQAVLVAAPVAPRGAGQPGVPAAGRVPAALVAMLLEVQAEVLGALQPVPAAHLARVEMEDLEAVPAQAALADLLVVPTEVLEEEVRAVVQAVAAGRPQPAL
ncbi:MAG TPA: hypothetical protein VF208_09465 [Candidatus Binatia bacterium]